MLCALRKEIQKQQQHNDRATTAATITQTQMYCDPFTFLSFYSDPPMHGGERFHCNFFLSMSFADQVRYSAWQILERVSRSVA